MHGCGSRGWRWWWRCVLRGTADTWGGWGEGVLASARVATERMFESWCKGCGCWGCDLRALLGLSLVRVGVLGLCPGCKCSGVHLDSVVSRCSSGQGRTEVISAAAKAVHTCGPATRGGVLLDECVVRGGCCERRVLSGGCW